MFNMLIAQSGGPTATMNAVLSGAIRGGKQNGFNVRGAENGVEGVLTSRFIELGDFSEEKLNLLSLTPAAFLGSCRFSLPDFSVDPTLYKSAFAVFDKEKIDAFVIIGGFDSMKTAKLLADYGKQIGSDVCIIGVPKTIDNNIKHTDFCCGFGSAAKLAATLTKEIYADSKSYSSRSVTIIEFMGRDTGWLCASSALAKTKDFPAPHFVYLAELPFDVNSYIQDLENCGERNIVVAVSEGLRYQNGEYLCRTNMSPVTSGSFGGCGKVLESITREALGYKTRAIEISTLQRCGGHLMSETDYRLSLKMGREVAKHASRRETCMLGFCKAGENWNIQPVELAGVTIERREVERRFINAVGNNITDEYREFCAPLIQGEVVQQFVGGLPHYM